MTSRDVTTLIDMFKALDHKEHQSTLNILEDLDALKRRYIEKNDTISLLEKMSCVGVMCLKMDRLHKIQEKCRLLHIIYSYIYESRLYRSLSSYLSFAQCIVSKYEEFESNDAAQPWIQIYRPMIDEMTDLYLIANVSFEKTSPISRPLQSINSRALTRLPEFNLPLRCNL